MLRPDSLVRPVAGIAPTAALQPNVRPAAGLSQPGGQGFGALFGDVRASISDFIDHGGEGDSTSSMAATSLSLQGQAWRDAAASSSVQPQGAVAGADEETQQAFLSTIAPWTQEAGARLGVSPDLVAAHAALESGWGRKPLRQADGTDTNNLFGIKAGGSWQGDVTAAATTEVEGGVPTAKTENFRSYPDQGSAFRDYAQLLLDNPRYRSALNTGGDARAFAQGLARGGYATDPGYADKLARVASRIQSRE